MGEHLHFSLQVLSRAHPTSDIEPADHILLAFQALLQRLHERLAAKQRVSARNTVSQVRTE